MRVVLLRPASDRTDAARFIADRINWAIVTANMRGNLRARLDRARIGINGRADIVRTLVDHLCAIDASLVVEDKGRGGAGAS